MPVPSQGHYGFHSFPVVDWFCLFIYLWVLTFPLLDCSEFGNFVITLIYNLILFILLYILPMVYRTHGILTALDMVYRTLYPWYFDLPTHGISNPLPMVFRPPIHGILTPIPMVFWPLYPWYFDPPTHGISTPYPWYIKPSLMVLWTPLFW